jgi:hypothetical protein
VLALLSIQPALPARLELVEPHPAPVITTKSCVAMRNGGTVFA